MKRAVVFALLVVGCGSARPHVRPDPDDQDDNPRTRTHSVDVPEPEAVASAMRPSIELTQLIPDSTDRGRWPLGIATHPMLEPHFDVASALAVPGIGWLELCGRGIQNRRLVGTQDPVEYLRAWCSAQNHQTADAIFRLASMKSTLVPGIRAALWLDIANILADSGDANDAAKLIDRNGLAHEVELLDILAATYVEVGRRSDAIELNKLAMDADHSRSSDAMCHRLARDIVIEEGNYQEAALAALHDRVKSRLYGCAPIEHELQCWVNTSRCDDYFNDRGVDPRFADVYWAYTQWPTSGIATSFKWWRIGVSASHAIGILGADSLAVTALEASLRSSGCDHQRLLDLFKALDGIRKDPNRDQHFDARVDTLLVRLANLPKVTPDLCKRELAAMP